MTKGVYRRKGLLGAYNFRGLKLIIITEDSLTVGREPWSGAIVWTSHWNLPVVQRASWQGHGLGFENLKAWSFFLKATLLNSSQTIFQVGTQHSNVWAYGDIFIETTTLIYFMKCLVVGFVAFSLGCAHFQ